MESHIENPELTLRQICQAFRIPGSWHSWEEIKVGNINRTYRVNFMQEDGAAPGGGKVKSYMVQQINTFVFRDPAAVMENIDMVTEHIRAKSREGAALHFHHTRDHRIYVCDGDSFWRLFNYIPSRTVDSCQDPEMIRNAGRAFGKFQKLLADFDASRLHVTIPDFHDTRKRYEKLAADAEADCTGKTAEVREELDWLLSVRDQACILTDRYHRGELPIRVTHNDTKLNNVLFEQDGTQAIAVIDLDTVMPGLVGHDFGDAIRSAANFVEEDSPAADRAGMNLEVFRAFAEGFLTCTASTLTENEIGTLARSAFALTCEQAVRFLDDYLLGSPYFRIEYPAHNLVRTRCQIALAKDMLAKMGEMERIVRQCAENG